MVARVLKLRWWFLWDLPRKPLFAGLLMALSVWLVELALNPGKGPTPDNLIKLVVMLIVGAIVYGLCLYFLDAGLVNKNLRRLVKAFLPGLARAQ